jgi:hypothetical protein
MRPKRFIFNYRAPYFCDVEAMENPINLPIKIVTIPKNDYTAQEQLTGLEKTGSQRGF